MFSYEVCPHLTTLDLLHCIMIFTSWCRNMFWVKFEKYCIIGLIVFFFQTLHLNQRNNCLYNKFKNAGEEINTDLQLLLHSNRKTWWRHKPCFCQLRSEHYPALGMCSLNFQDVQRLSTHKFITNNLHCNYTPSDIQNQIL